MTQTCNLTFSKYDSITLDIIIVKGRHIYIRFNKSLANIYSCSGFLLALKIQMSLTLSILIKKALAIESRQQTFNTDHKEKAFHSDCAVGRNYTEGISFEKDQKI